MNEEELFAMDFEDDDHKFIREEKARLQPPILKVYLAGPLTNNNASVQADCESVRAVIKRLLHAYDYLGIRFEVYDPADVTQPGSSHTDEQVYEMDHDKTMSADLVIFHINAPSLGVGSESQIAADATVPRVTIVKTGASISRMFRGIFSPSIADLQYSDCSEIELKFSRQIARIARRTIESAVARRELMASFEVQNLGRKIFEQRILHSLSIERLAELTDIKECWLRRLERTPVLAMCVSAIQLTRIAAAVKCHVKMINDQIPTLAPHEPTLDSPDKDSLENLLDCLLTGKKFVADEEVFRVWRRFRESAQLERTEAMAHRTGEQKVMTCDQWSRLLFPDTLYG